MAAKVENLVYRLRVSGLRFQENIKFFDKSLLTAGKIKRDQKTNCIPGEIIEYGFSERKFVHVSYYVQGPDEDNVLKSSFGKFKGEKNTDYFAEIYKPGKVSLLKFYIPPILTKIMTMQN